MQRSRQKLQNAIPMALLFATPTENINSWYYPRKYRRNVLYTGRFLPKIETIFSSARRQCIVAGKHFNFFFSSSFLSYDLLPSMYRHDSDGSRTPLRERTNRQRRKARKFLWTTISLPRYTDWYSWKKTILRWNDISFKPLNLKNIRLNESLIARKKIASYPLNNNYDSEEKIKNLIYIPTCTSRYIKTGK